jgi:hypothetical protein
MARLTVNFTRKRSRDRGSSFTRAAAGGSVANRAQVGVDGAGSEPAPAGRGVASDTAPLCVAHGGVLTLVGALPVRGAVSDGHRMAPFPKGSSVTIGASHAPFSTGSLTAQRSGSFRMLDGTSG